MTISALLLALLAIFAAAKLFGELAERIGQPAVLGEMFGGIVIGVSGLHLIDPHNSVLHLLSQLGVVLLLFLIGLETDLKRLLSVRGASVVADILGLVLLAVVSAAAAGEKLTTLAIARVFALAFGFVAIAIVIGSILAPHLIRWIARLRVVKALFFTSLMFAFALAWLADLAGSALIIGAFAAGRGLARTERGGDLE